MSDETIRSYAPLVVGILFILLAAAVSKRIRGSIITLPMIYVVLGLILSDMGLGLVRLDMENEFVRIIAELTLVLVLASDAARINMRTLVKDYNLPIRLLAVGLLLTMILGSGLAALVFEDLSLAEAAIIGILLAPTDASLGQAVISNPLIPVHIRQTLNIESGLNDGIAIPFLLLAIAVAEAEEFGGIGYWINLGVTQILLGTVFGLVVGLVGWRFVSWGRSSGWMSRHFRKISAVALALLAYALAGLFGGNGFIAAFVMGVTIGNVPVEDKFDEMHEHVEVEVDLLILLTFMVVFGAIMLPEALRMFDWKVVLYAILSLTVVRLLPVVMSMIGARVKGITVGFLGWFGPRGTASILYLFTVLEAEKIPEMDTIYTVTLITVLFSVFAHGISAAPAANWYGRIMGDEEIVGEDAVERQEVPVMPVRGPAAKENM
jgi:NhaP-type Na+/H+ or K+/H+ antiporter